MSTNYNLKDIVEENSFSKIEYFVNKYEKEIENVDDKERPIKLNSEEKSKISMYLVIPFSILNLIIINATNSILMTVLFFILSILSQVAIAISIIKVKENINKNNYKEDIRSFKNPSFLVENTGYFKNKKVLREIRTNYLILTEKEKKMFEDYLYFKNVNKQIKNKEEFLKNLFISQLNKKTNHKYIFEKQKKIINFIKENFLEYPEYTKECLGVIKEAIKNYQEFSKDIESEIQEIEKIKEEKVNVSKGIIRNI